MYKLVTHEGALYGVLKTTAYTFYKRSNIQITPLLDPAIKLKSFVWNIPRPNILVLYKFLNAAVEVYKKNKTELAVFVLYDTVNKEYVLHYPVQTVSSGGCKFEYSDTLPNTIMVLDMHSHHTMGAFYSGTDDDDDKKISQLVPHLSIVVGKINSFNFTDLKDNVKIRMSFNGEFENLTIEDIFDDAPLMFQSWDKLIKEQPAAVVSNYHKSWGAEYGLNLDDGSESAQRCDNRIVANDPEDLYNKIKQKQYPEDAYNVRHKEQALKEKKAIEDVKKRQGLNDGVKTVKR